MLFPMVGRKEILPWLIRLQYTCYKPVAVKGWRHRYFHPTGEKKTGEEFVFAITLLWILSDISLILDFIVSLDSGIYFIVWDAFSPSINLTLSNMQGLRRFSAIVYGFLAFATCKAMTYDACTAGLLLFKKKSSSVQFLSFQFGQF